MLGVILAGGEGTRLRPLTENRPKPYVPILGRPCIEYTLDALKELGVEDVIVTAHYRPLDIIGHLRGGSESDLRIFYSVEDTPLGTAGGVARARGIIKERFVVMSGDLLVDADLRPMVEFHERSGALVTMALTEVVNPTEYGIVGLDKEGRINRFLEKPKEDEVFSNLINAGIYVMEPEVLDRVPQGKYDFSRDLFPELMEEGLLYGHTLKGLWIDIGRPSDLLLANREMAKKARKIGADLIDEDATIRGETEGEVMVRKGAIIEEGAVVRNSFIHENVVISEGCEVENSLILEDTVLGRKTQIRDSIIGANARIGIRVKLEECVLGDGTHIKDGSWLVRQKRS